MSRLAQGYLQSKFTLQRKVGSVERDLSSWLSVEPVEWLSACCGGDHTFVRVNSRVLLLSRDAKS